MEHPKYRSRRTVVHINIIERKVVEREREYLRASVARLVTRLVRRNFVFTRYLTLTLTRPLPTDSLSEACQSTCF